MATFLTTHGTTFHIALALEEGTNGGKLDHVLARAELEMLSDEVMHLVGMLGSTGTGSIEIRGCWWRGGRRSTWCR